MCVWRSGARGTRLRLTRHWAVRAMHESDSVRCADFPAIASSNAVITDISHITDHGHPHRHTVHAVTGQAGGIYFGIEV